VRKFTPETFIQKEVLEMFTRLDDTDIVSAIKQWQYCSDLTLSILCKMLTERKLPKLTFFDNVPDINLYNRTLQNISSYFGSNSKVDPSYFVKIGEVINRGYDSKEGEIMIISRAGEVKDVYEISDMLSARAFSQVTKKYFLCIANLKK